VRQPLSQSREPADICEKDGRGAHHRSSKTLAGWHFGDALDVPLPEPHEASQVGSLHRRRSRALKLNQRVTSSNASALAIMFSTELAIQGPFEALPSLQPHQAPR